MSISILTLKDYGIKNGNLTILDSITLEVGEKGILNILGSATAEKSALIRTLSGFNRSNPNYKITGEANYLGLPIGQTGYPAMVIQSSKLMLSSVLENILHNFPDKKNLNLIQQHEMARHLLEGADLGELVDCIDMNVVDLPLETIRHLAIARVCAANPGLIFIDEPTTGLESDCPHKMLNYIKSESEKRAVVVITKSREHARLLGGRSILLEGGQLKENTSTEELLSSQKFITEEGEEGGRAYSISLAEIKQAEEFRNASNHQILAPVDINSYKNVGRMPKGFRWLKEGKIAGMPELGTATDLERDIEALHKLGVTHLVTLASEKGPVDLDLLAKYKISSMYEPIDELAVPTIERASYLCEEIGHLINGGNVVAIHCGTGFGRTGVLLASHLIWEGLNAQQAIESVREIEPKSVRSDEQVQFLKEFARETTGVSDFETNVVNKVSYGSVVN
jgi:atypical dual specificity phosphatase